MLGHSAVDTSRLIKLVALSDDLIAEPLQIAGGRITVPAAAGAGAVIDEDKLERYRRDRGRA